MVVGGTLMETTYNASQAVAAVDTVSNYSVVMCMQQLPNESNSTCNALATGTVTNASWVAGNEAFDKNWITNSTSFTNGTPAFITFAYTVPANTTTLLYEYKYDNATGVATTTNVTAATLATNCRNSTGTITMRVNVTANETFRLECINSSGVYTNFTTLLMPNESFQFFEQRMWWSVNKSVNNYTITNAVIDDIFSSASLGVTTYTALIPILVLTLVGGASIALLIHYVGRTSA